MADEMDIDSPPLSSPGSVDLIRTGTPEALVIRSAIPRRDRSSSSTLSDAPSTPTRAPPIRRMSSNMPAAPLSSPPSFEQAQIEGQALIEKFHASLSGKRSQTVRRSLGSPINFAQLGPAAEKDLSPDQELNNNLDPDLNPDSDSVHALVDEYLSAPDAQKKPVRAGYPSHIAIPVLPQLDIRSGNLQPIDPTDRGQAEALLKHEETATQLQTALQNAHSSTSKDSTNVLPSQPPANLPQQESQTPSFGAIGALLEPLKPRIVIAISGAPCAGKTTIALLLHFLLNTVTSTTILHQHSFSRRREDCPISTWQSPSEREKKHFTLMNEQEVADRRAQLHWDNNAVLKPQEVYNPDDPLLYYYAFPTKTGSRIKKLIEERFARGQEAIQTQRGGNMVCKQAYNWPQFMHRLVSLRAGCAPEISPNENPLTQERMLYDARLHCSPFVLSYLREQFCGHMKETLAKNKQCGFPGKNVNTFTSKLREIVIVEGPMLYIKPGQGVYGEDGEKIMKELDIKLFITTSEKEIRKRAFRDHVPMHHGGSTEPPNYWESESYFDGLTWPHFLTTHSWIFTDGDPTLGQLGDPKTAHLRGVSAACTEQNILVQMVPDHSVEYLMEWCVEMILGQIITDEANARSAFMRQRRDANKTKKAADERGKVLQSMMN